MITESVMFKSKIWSHKAVSKSPKHILFPWMNSWQLLWQCQFSLWHHDIIKWKHFPRYWPFGRGIHQSPVNSPNKGQWCGALMFSLIFAWINSWVNNHEASDLRSHCAHYDVTVMSLSCKSCKLFPYDHWRDQSMPNFQKDHASNLSPECIGGCQFAKQTSSDASGDDNPYSKVHGANMGPTWVLSAPDGPHVGPMNLAIMEVTCMTFLCVVYWVDGILNIQSPLMHG